MGVGGSIVFAYRIATRLCYEVSQPVVKSRVVLVVFAVKGSRQPGMEDVLAS